MKIKPFIKGEVEETAAADADQRNFKTKASIADMAAELENDQQEKVTKLSQAHDVSARTVYTALIRTSRLSKKSAR
jgi:hypothetical protein